MPSNDGELKENDCTVKFKGAAFATGANNLYISDSIKDAYGNKVDDDTRVSFNNVKDETKPTVTSVSMIDSSTIRVTFSKDIDKTYATKVSNYTLKDNSDLDITSHIDYIRPANSSITDDSTASVNSISNDNVWDIKMASGDDNKLTGSKYSLKIKNLIDTTSNKNVMAEYTTTLTGNDDVAPKLSDVRAKNDSDHHKVVLSFSEAMDTSTLNDLSNYKYQNASGDTNSLPSSTKITASNDAKSVTIEFPSSYYVNGTAGKDNDNIIYKILTSGLKDEAGNTIDSFANSGTVAAASATSTLTYKDKTFRIEDDGDDLLVKFQFDKSIDSDTLDKSSFAVAGETPDSVNIDGSNLVLRYNKDQKGVTLKSNVATYAADPLYTATTLDKIEAIKAQGANAQLVLNIGTLKDLTGAVVTNNQTVSNTTTTLATKVYDYLAKPKTTSDFWYAVNNYNDGNGTTGSAVVLTFDNVIDTHSGIKTDDYTFTINGEEVKADSLVKNGNTLVFVFSNTTKAAKFVSGQNVGVALKNTSADIEALEDDNSNYAIYTPSSDDTTKTRQVTIR